MEMGRRSGERAGALSPQILQTLLLIVACALCVTTATPHEVSAGGHVISLSTAHLDVRQCPESPSVVTTGVPEGLQQVLLGVRGCVRNVVGSCATDFLPPGSPDWLIEHPVAERVEEEPASKRANDTATLQTGATQVWNSTRMPATGKGVIVGFLDSGIDWRHLDFRQRNDTLRTRILSIWDTGSDVGPPPSGFDYGTEWTREQIERAIRGDGPEPPRDTQMPSNGHGTFVAGSACGMQVSRKLVLLR